MNPDALITYRLLADLVLVFHVAIVMFVAGGLGLVIAGNWRGWLWVNALWFRLMHFACVLFVVAQAWWGAVCPLTVLELWLRAKAGQATYAGSFIGHWLQGLLYYDAPAWAFTLVYSLFGMAVAAAWWRFPPRLSRNLSKKTL